MHSIFVTISQLKTMIEILIHPTLSIFTNSPKASDLRILKNIFTPASFKKYKVLFLKKKLLIAMTLRRVFHKCYITCNPKETVTSNMNLKTVHLMRFKLNLHTLKICVHRMLKNLTQFKLALRRKQLPSVLWELLYSLDNLP